MKISTVSRDLYMMKINMLVLLFLMPIFVVLLREYNASTRNKVLYILVNVYLWCSVLGWINRVVFKSYIKRIDNGRDLDSSGKWFSKFIFLSINVIGYIFCIYNHVGLRKWLIFLIFYKFTMSVVMGFVVISDNYFMYKDRIFIIKNIDYFNIKDRNLLTIAFKDKHKYIVRVKKRLAADINTCLSILVNNEG
ncbi:MAG: hypothetical protein GX370_03545 [Clostridia bacterium]|jgi:hypothetical protein|nr:hypothetical protein [Clostridia bacterium]